MAEEEGLPPLRVALIGYGLAGSVFHAPLIRASPSLRLVTVVSGNPERQAHALADNPGVSIVGGAEALWKAAAAHDVVVIAAPTGAHVSLGRAAIEAGLGVVMDKPLASDSRDARELAQLAARRGTLLTVFHNRRWDGDLLTLERLRAAGELGDVFRFESRFERFRPAPRPGGWREEVSAEEGGGILLDLGSHIVDQAVYLLGRPARVYAEIATRRPGARVDDDVFIALGHRHGAVSHLWASAAAAIPGPRLRALGVAGAYSKDGLDIQEEALRAGADPRRPGWSDEPPERWGTMATESGSVTVETEAGAWASFYEGVARSLREGTPPPVTADSAVEVLEILDAARESARTSSVVDLPAPGVVRA
jgi:scyllo-inositol 2-dehydrogenase (NADP+)